MKPVGKTSLKFKDRIIKCFRIPVSGYAVENWNKVTVNLLWIYSVYHLSFYSQPKASPPITLSKKMVGPEEDKTSHQ